MNPDQWKQLHAGELAFFAKISASISHEIKNHLAIINEQNGLMGDFLCMAEQGKPLSLDRLHAVVKDVARQVTMTDYIVRRFNTFAHTADSPVKSVDVPDFLNLLVEIAGRLARLKEMDLVLEDMPEHVVIQTHPFEFLHILYFCLNMLLSAGRPGESLALNLVPGESRVRILITAGQDWDMAKVAVIDPALRVLMDRLQAAVTVPGDSPRIVLDFPLQLAPEED